MPKLGGDEDGKTSVHTPGKGCRTGRRRRRGKMQKFVGYGLVSIKDNILRARKKMKRSEEAERCTRSRKKKG